MTVLGLINKLKEYPMDMPITLNECMDFSESVGDTIKVTKRRYIGFPFTEEDQFDYVNLEIADKEYWE